MTQWSRTSLPVQEMQVQSLGREDPRGQEGHAIPGGGNGNPLQYPGLENLTDRGDFGHDRGAATAHAAETAGSRVCH